MTRKLAGIDSNASIQLWSSGFATLCFLPLSATEWVWPSVASSYAALISMGVFGALSHISSTAAHRVAEASVLAPFGYAQIISATVVGVLIFGEDIETTTYCGCVVVVAAGIYIWIRESKL